MPELNRLPNLETRNLKPIQVIGLLAMANIKDRSGIKADDFYGMESSVGELLSDQVEALRTVLAIRLGIQWDGKERLWPLLVEACRAECCADKLKSEVAASANKAANALKILEYSKEFPGKLNPNLLGMARHAITSATGSSESGDRVSGNLHGSPSAAGSSGPRANDEKMDREPRKATSTIPGTSQAAG